MASGCTREEHSPACSVGSRPGKIQSPGMGGTSRLATTSCVSGMSSNNESGDDSRELMLLILSVHPPASTVFWDIAQTKGSTEVWQVGLE